MGNGRIYIGSDHRGFELKAAIAHHLSEEGYSVEDLGPHAYDKDDDFLDFAEQVCRETLRGGGRGILICGSGHGMSMAANKVKGIRAALCWNAKSGRWAKEHQDANIICIASQIGSARSANGIVSAWLNADFGGEERYARRISRLNKM